MSDAEPTATDSFVEVLALAAPEWLTFERFRQEFEANAGIDVVAFAPRSRNLSQIVRNLLDPARGGLEVQKATIALTRMLSGHSKVARSRYGVDRAEAKDAVGAMQAMLRARDDIFARWGDFKRGMDRIELTVCHVRIDNIKMGSGFLISEKHVLTAHHCISSLVESDGTAKPESWKRLHLDFDDVAAPGAFNGAFITSADVAEHWLTLQSIQDPAESTSAMPLQTLTANSLDFAIIQLKDPIGLKPPRHLPKSARGWVDLADLPPTPQTDSQMLIAHFPGGADLRLSVGLFDTHSGCMQRVRYRTPTILGSSGAPCFDISWKPFALHNAGYETVGLNQGVPLSAVVAALGTLSSLREPPKLPIPIVTTDDRPVLGRTLLWDVVDAVLARSSEVTVISVASAKSGGKSFTADLLRSALVEQGHFAVVADAENYAGDTPESFSMRLIREISGREPEQAPPPSPDSRQRARWVTQQLTAWIREEVSPQAPSGDLGGARRTLWILIDRLDASPLAQPTRDLLLSLLSDAALDKEQPVRFVLFGYDGDLTSVLPARLASISLDLISASGFEPYVRYVMSSLLNDPPEQTVLDMATDMLLQALNPETDIPHVCDAMMRWRTTRIARAKKD